MTTLIIGDVQGCYQELEQLLTKCGFDEGKDHLWLVGDLINRGPENSAVLDWLINTPKVTSVLGNHDLHFLAVALGERSQSKGDTLNDLLESPKRDIYIDYLRNLPLIHTSSDNENVLVHAGVPPNLDIQSSLSLANEVEEVLKSDKIEGFLESLYGNNPSVWNKTLKGQDRLRLITNWFTRMRYCKEDGELELTHKEAVSPAGFQPWYTFERTDQIRVFFGHWAAIEGKTGNQWATALDTGCVWGGKLSAFDLEKNCLISVNSRTKKK